MQVQRLEDHDQAMQSHAREVDRKYAAVFRQLQDVHANWCAVEADKSRLQEEVAVLKALQVRDACCHIQVWRADGLAWVKVLSGSIQEVH